MDPAWVQNTTFSFGMIPHRKEEGLFAKVVDKFKRLGATHLKASILNNFANQVDEIRYKEICDQIDWAHSLGIRTIRINDSVGKLYPETTEVLCRKLVADYPDIVFCLHCHNDRGLALANQLISIYNGFQMVEGSLCGYGNRSGITPIEILAPICADKNIVLASGLDAKKLCETAQFAEHAFLQIPNVFRPISGKFVNKANFGVLNIPDFLGAGGDRDYFLNVINLHPNTLKQALKGQGFADHVLEDPQFTAAVSEKLKGMIESKFADQQQKFSGLLSDILNFYQEAQLSVGDLIRLAQETELRPTSHAIAAE